jgi:glycosyltransferase involved in cell wall biosynthesis
MGATVAGQIGPSRPTLQNANVALLINYITPAHQHIFQTLSDRIGRLTVLVSTAMEPNRKWRPDWGRLNVRPQKNWMITRKWQHTNGFEEDNYLHVPWDTTLQLKQLKPDVVISYEMGARTLLSSFYRMLHRHVPLIMVTNMSEHTEQGRGALRRRLRKYIVRRVDFATYNGPSCRRYLKRLGLTEEKLFHVPYAADPNRVYRGPIVRATRSAYRIFYSGALSQRKGIVPFYKCLIRWCQSNPHRSVEMAIAGTGSFQLVLEMMSRPPNLKLSMLGHCEADALCECYADADLYVYPTLADEWGLGIEEALASGVPVMASPYSQAAEVLCRDGKNCWLFSPDQPDGMQHALNTALNTDRETLAQMGERGRAATSHICPDYAANKLAQVIQAALQKSAKPARYKR